MKLLARSLAVGLGALFLPACLPFALFEDVGTDPHPPTVAVLGIAVQPPDPVEGEPLPPPAVFLPVEGFVIRPNDASRNRFILRVEFTDAGGDVLLFRLRDRDSTFNVDATPAAPEIDTNLDGIPDETLDAPEFYVGTTQIIRIPDLEFEVTAQAGVHRMEVWAEDSHDSRSPKVEFTVTVVL